MCFHYALSKTAIEIENRFDASFRDKTIFKPIYHGSGFSYSQWPVITMEDSKTISYLNWGLIPFWTKNLNDALRLRQLTLNAQGETVFSKPSFKYSITSKRCLVLSSGFYEWKHIGKEKYPYYIYLKNNDLMAMGGLYSTWINKETDEVFNTFSIITTAANPLMEDIHNTKKRMPLILTNNNEKNWLNCDLKQNDIIDIIKPLDQGLMNAHTISKLINSPNANRNSSDIQKPFSYTELNTLF